MFLFCSLCAASSTIWARWVSLTLVRLERASRVISLSCSFVNPIAGATRNFSLQCKSQ
jgi:hypothetical protein